MTANAYLMTPEQIAAEGIPGKWALGLNDFVRSTDIDDYRHVNNAAYFRWFENLRELYMHELAQTYNDGQAVKHAVRKATIDYDAPLFMHDAYVTVARTDRVGRSSYHMVLQAWSGGTLRCTSTALMVAVDDKAQKSRPIPPAMRQVMIERDGAVEI